MAHPISNKTPRHPFAKPHAQPGEGHIDLKLLPPNNQVLTSCEYQYPLKLISPDPHKLLLNDAKTNREVSVTTVFLLTYGGGLLAGDSINLTIDLDAHTRLALLTQGSTKIFKADDTPVSAPLSVVSYVRRETSQILNVKISPGAALCYLPDPNQPFAESTYVQRQTFYVDPYGSSSLLFLDWVSEGRTARGEKWTLKSWMGRNEVREFDETSQGRLLIRDALNLSSDNLVSRTDGKGILGTMIIYGPMFRKLGDFFMKEFKALPRIGAKTWAQPKTPTIVEEDEGPDYFGFSTGRAEPASPATALRSPVPKMTAKKREEPPGLVWTAAQVRGFVLVKFGADDVDGARRWLGGMLKREGSVEREFGHQALLCVK